MSQKVAPQLISKMFVEQKQFPHSDLLTIICITYKETNGDSIAEEPWSSSGNNFVRIFRNADEEMRNVLEVAKGNKGLSYEED